MKIRSNTLFQANPLDLFERLESEYFDLIYINPLIRRENEYFEKMEQIELEDYFFKIIQQSKRCLKQTGHLIFFTDSRTPFNIQIFLETIFDRQNFIAEFILPNRNISFSKQPIGRWHNSLFLYSSSEEAKLNYVFDNVVSKEFEKRFNKEDSKGKFLLSSPFSSFERPNLVYEWKGNYPPKGMSWKFSKEKLDELNNENLIFFRERDSRPAIKRYLSESSKPLIGTIWDDIQHVDLELSREYPGAQSLELTNRIISLTTSKNNQIFVPFSGEGSLLVSASKLGRKWIGNCDSNNSKKIIEQRLKESRISFSKPRLKSDIIWNQYSSLIKSEEDILIEQIEAKENQGLEFKSGSKWNYHTNNAEKGLVEKILKEIAGFLNSKEGGRLLIGVSDDGEIFDLHEDFITVNPQKRDSDGYTLFLTDKIRENLGPQSVRFFEISFPIVKGKQICQIQIKPSKQPVFFNGDFIVRIGTQAVKFSPEETYRYLISNKML